MRKSIFLGLIAVALSSPIHADSINIAPTQTGTAATGQIPGTTTNDAAAAGKVGEILTNSTTGTSLTSTVAANGTSQSLTAGDWDVWCNAKFAPAASTAVTDLIVEISTASATVSATLGNYTRTPFAAAVTVVPIAMVTPTVTASLSGSTTYYCIVYAQFGVSTMTADAKIVARRRR